MAEGFVTASGASGAAVHDNREHEPAPSAEAPRGWTWNRAARSWRPKVRGVVLWHDDGAPADDGDDESSPQVTGAFSGSTPDPEPGWMSDPAPQAEKHAVSASDRADIKALIALAYLPLSEGLSTLDPFCFGVLTERKTATGVIDAVADIVAASPRVSQWALSATGLSPWIKLAVALRPVASNFVAHHVTRRVEVEKEEDGTITVTERDFSMFTAA